MAWQKGSPTYCLVRVSNQVAAMTKDGLSFTVHYYPADSVKMQIPLHIVRYGYLQVSNLITVVGKALNLVDVILGIFFARRIPRSYVPKVTMC